MSQAEYDRLFLSVNRIPVNPDLVVAGQVGLLLLGVGAVGGCIYAGHKYFYPTPPSGVPAADPSSPISALPVPKADPSSSSSDAPASDSDPVSSISDAPVADLDPAVMVSGFRGFVRAAKSADSSGLHAFAAKIKILPHGNGVSFNHTTGQFTESLAISLADNGAATVGFFLKFNC
jgi:hypothetical protein